MKRNIILDILKGIGILLVIFGHTFSYNTIIYYFHMPLFFFLSGMSLYYLLNKCNNFKDFFRKKICSIIIPYLFFSIISIIYWILIERKIRGQLNISILQNFFNIFIAKCNSKLYSYNIAMWFLPCLFTSELIFFIIMKLKNEYLKIFIVILSFIIGYSLSINNFVFPFGLETALIGLLFIYIGYITINISMKIFNKKQLNKFKRLKPIFLFFSIFCLLLCYNLGSRVSMLSHLYNNVILFLFGAFSGIYLCYLTATFCEKKAKKAFQFLGRNTIIIMGCHEPIKRIVIKIFSVIINQADSLLRKNILFSLTVTISTIIIIIPIIYFINNFFPFIIGKFSFKNKE